MKKIFMIFAVCFNTTSVFATAGDPINTPSQFEILSGYNFTSNRGYNYMKDGTCAVTTRSNDRANEYLYAANTNTGSAYEADTTQCPNNTQICILGYSTVENDTKTNHCWHADVPRGLGGDSWISDKSLENCSGGKWTPRSANKIPVFVNNRGQILATAPTYTSGNLVDSLIGTDVVNDFDIKCVAYICIESDNSLSYGCQDGSCTDGCPDDDTTPPAPDPDPAPDPVDPSPAPVPDPVPTPTPTNDGPHKNTVQPYLDALKAKCKK